MAGAGKDRNSRRLPVLDEMLKGLPQEPIPVESVRIGPFLTVVCLGGTQPRTSQTPLRCGLASTLASHEHGRKTWSARLRTLEDLSAQELAGYLKSSFPLEASVGLSALNAMLPVPPHCFQETPALDMVIEHGRDEPVAVIGHFPFVERLREEAGELHVLELKTIPGDRPAAQAGEILPRCRTVVLTATVLMNGTYHDMLPFCRQPFTVMMGPSTPASPVLWRYGVDVLAGSTVVNPEECLRAVSQGAGYRDLKESVKKWTWKRKT